MAETTTVKLNLKSASGMQLNPTHVFVVGLIVIPSLVFQSNLLLKWLQVSLFVCLSAAAGKRVRILPNVIMVGGIVAANLLTPVGRVLWSLGGWRITLGALENGLHRAALLIGMIYISRFSIRRGFSLPGRVGGLLSLVFFYLERILQGERLSRGNLIEKVDERIIAVHQSSTEYSPLAEHHSPGATNLTGMVYLGSVVALSWALFAYPHIERLL